MIARGQAPGLRIEPQWTNTLFDLILSALWRFGPAAAQKIAVAAAVLIFFWGALSFLRAVARTEPWFLAPMLGMLSYGWVFHAGFFNFYIALGLSFRALALACRRGAGRGRITAALAMLALAYTAHALPVIWAGGVAAYLGGARALRPRYRIWLALGSVAVLAAGRRLLESRFEVLWYREQIGSITGADQISVYGVRYQMLGIVLAGIWSMLTVEVLRRRGWRRLVLSPLLHIALLTAAAVAIMPSRILIPGYAHALGFIAERMSLAIAVCVCGLAAAARLRPGGSALIGALAAAFFVCLYVDQRAVNRIEDRLERAVSRLPAGARVVSSLGEPGYRVDPLVHLIDRACVGRCFSYANYEAATRQFRIRAQPGNPFVVTRYADAYALQSGTYQVRASDLPLWGVFPAEDREEFAVRPLQAAELFPMARVMAK